MISFQSLDKRVWFCWDQFMNILKWNEDLQVIAQLFKSVLISVYWVTRQYDQRNLMGNICQVGDALRNVITKTSHSLAEGGKLAGVDTTCVRMGLQVRVTLKNLPFND